MKHISRLASRALLASFVMPLAEPAEMRPEDKPALLLLLFRYSRPGTDAERID
jgi:hypothetical protein